MLGDCIYCSDRLTSELQSVTCDHCGTGFHVACARDAGELSVEEKAHFLRSNTYHVECPDCGERWNAGFDLRE
nr:RING finger protein [Halomicroarcula amylolytica]